MRVAFLQRRRDIVAPTRHLRGSMRATPAFLSARSGSPAAPLRAAQSGRALETQMVRALSIPAACPSIARGRAFSRGKSSYREQKRRRGTKWQGTGPSGREGATAPWGRPGARETGLALRRSPTRQGRRTAMKSETTRQLGHSGSERAARMAPPLSWRFPSPPRAGGRTVFIVGFWRALRGAACRGCAISGPVAPDRP